MGDCDDLPKWMTPAAPLASRVPKCQKPLILLGEMSIEGKGGEENEN